MECYLFIVRRARGVEGGIRLRGTLKGEYGMGSLKGGDH